VIGFLENEFAISIEAHEVIAKNLGTVATMTAYVEQKLRRQYG